jgi:hypothetical protein
LTYRDIDADLNWLEEAFGFDGQYSPQLRGA